MAWSHDHERVYLMYQRDLIYNRRCRIIGRFWELIHFMRDDSDSHETMPNVLLPLPQLTLYPHGEFPLPSWLKKKTMALGLSWFHKICWHLSHLDGCSFLGPSGEAPKEWGRTPSILSFIVHERRATGDTLYTNSWTISTSLAKWSRFWKKLF